MLGAAIPSNLTHDKLLYRGKSTMEGTIVEFCTEPQTVSGGPGAGVMLKRCVDTCGLQTGNRHRKSFHCSISELRKPNAVMQKWLLTCTRPHAP